METPFEKPPIKPQKAEATSFSNGVLPEEIERFLVGGWRSTEELQKRLIGLSKQFLMKGVKINMKEHGTEYPKKKNYIDVAITPAGDILYGENGEVFKVKSGNN